MLVEDDNAIRYVYSKMKLWTKYGFFIEQEAANGMRAMDAMRANPVDIIFTDIQMPLMDGISLMKTMNKEFPNVLFVLISSYNEFEYAREGLRLGAVDYVVKPLTESDLEKVLQRAKEMLDARKSDTITPLLSDLPGIKLCSMEDPLLKNMCEYLSVNMQRNISMVDVADALKLNKDYFGKLVKNKTGQSFRNLYNQIKMEYAKKLIRSGQYKIYEISELLGYASADYFTQLFKNMTGMTPAEFKKQ